MIMWALVCRCSSSGLDAAGRSMRARHQPFTLHIQQAVPETSPRGFELLRAEPTGFLVRPLNHSDAVSCQVATETNDA